MRKHNWALFGDNSRTQFSRLWALRTFFFGLLSYDLISITFKHAARYGVDGFNVSHLAWLGQFLPQPTPQSVGTLWALCAMSACLAALNVLTAATIRLTAILYTGIYFWSQADSYQHHYLNAIILIVLASLPTRAWKPQQKDQPSKNTFPFIGLLYCQFALVYFWTAVAKIDPTWLSGTTMMSLSQSDTLLIYTSHISEMLYGTSGDPQLAHDALYRTLSLSVIAGELLVAVCFLVPKLRPLGLVLAPIFHLSVEFLGLDIELFSLYMIGINLILLSPSNFWANVQQWGQRLPSLPITKIPIHMVHLGLLVSGVICFLSLFGVPTIEKQTTLHSFLLPTLMALLITRTIRSTAAAKTKLWVACATTATSLAIPIALHQTEATYDYHRMLGGDLSRRLPPSQGADFDAKLERAIAVYGMANEMKPNKPARRLKQAQLILRSDATDRIARASKVLSIGYKIHTEHIDRLESSLLVRPTIAVREELIKTQLGLARITNALQRIPSEQRAISDRHLALMFSEMRQSSQRELTALNGMIRAKLIEDLKTPLDSLAHQGRYDPNTNLLLAKVKGEVGPNCQASLEMKGHRDMSRNLMRLGRGGPLPFSSLNPSQLDLNNCTSVYTHPLHQIVSVRTRRFPITKLHRAHKRTFGQ
ncbi:MAG: HTTM domain-containing protein [Bradymonadia bacterium]